MRATALVQRLVAPMNWMSFNYHRNSVQITDKATPSEDPVDLIHALCKQIENLDSKSNTKEFEKRKPDRWSVRGLRLLTARLAFPIVASGYKNRSKKKVPLKAFADG